MPKSSPCSFSPSRFFWLSAHFFTMRDLSLPLAIRQNEAMRQSLWVPSLVLALHQNRRAPASRFVQIATTRPDGRPSNRTLVFRGFINDMTSLTFAVDLRSEKAREIAHNPWVEACWYFPVTHEQFRLSGHATIVGDAQRDDEALQTARRDTWQALPEPTRMSYTWPPPGQRRDASVPFPHEHPDRVAPPGHFGILVLDPRAVDYLEINGQPQNRWQFERDDHGEWSGVEVNP